MGHGRKRLQKDNWLPIDADHSGWGGDERLARTDPEREILLAADERRWNRHFLSAFIGVHRRLIIALGFGDCGGLKPAPPNAGLVFALKAARPTQSNG
jgi:hypothetical protein